MLWDLNLHKNVCFVEFGRKVNIPMRPTKKPRMRGLGKTPNPNVRIIIIFFFKNLITQRAYLGEYFQKRHLKFKSSFYSCNYWIIYIYIYSFFYNKILVSFDLIIHLKSMTFFSKKKKKKYQQHYLPSHYYGKMKY